MPSHMEGLYTDIPGTDSSHVQCKPRATCTQRLESLRYEYSAEDKRLGRLAIALQREKIAPMIKLKGFEYRIKAEVLDKDKHGLQALQLDVPDSLLSVHASLTRKCVVSLYERMIRDGKELR